MRIKLGYILMAAALLLFFYVILIFLFYPQSKSLYTFLSLLSAGLGLVGTILSVSGGNNG